MHFLFEILISMSVATRTELLTVGLQCENLKGPKLRNWLWFSTKELYCKVLGIQEKINRKLPLQQFCHFEKFVSNHPQYGLLIHPMIPLGLVSNYANWPSRHRRRGTFQTIFCSTFSTFSSSSDLLNNKFSCVCPVGVRPVGALL